MPGKGSLPSYEDVEGLLVREIKENLSLEKSSSNSSPPVVPVHSPVLKAPKRVCSVRVSPYEAYSPFKKNWRVRRRLEKKRGEEDYHHHHHHHHHHPFKMLQELISDGSLIKEAVRRLQLGLSPKLTPNYYEPPEEEPPSAPGPLCCEVLQGGGGGGGGGGGVVGGGGL